MCTTEKHHSMPCLRPRHILPAGAPCAGLQKRQRAGSHMLLWIAASEARERRYGQVNSGILQTSQVHGLLQQIFEMKAQHTVTSKAWLCLANRSRHGHNEAHACMLAALHAAQRGLTLSFVMKFRPATNMWRPLAGGVALRPPGPPPPPYRRGGEKPRLGGDRLKAKQPHCQRSRALEQIAWRRSNRTTKPGLAVPWRAENAEARQRTGEQMPNRGEQPTFCHRRESTPGEVEESVCNSPCHPRPHKATWPAALCRVRANVCDTLWKVSVSGTPWRGTACAHRVKATFSSEDRESLLVLDCALSEAWQQRSVSASQLTENGGV